MLIETEVDPYNENIRTVATELLKSDNPPEAAFDWVKGNVGYAPNLYTSIIEAMANQGTPVVGFTVIGRSRLWNEVYSKGVNGEVRKDIVDFWYERYGEHCPKLEDESRVVARYNQFGSIVSQPIGSPVGQIIPEEGRPAWKTLLMVTAVPFLTMMLTTPAPEGSREWINEKNKLFATLAGGLFVGLLLK